MTGVEKSGTAGQDRERRRKIGNGEAEIGNVWAKSGTAARKPSYALAASAYLPPAKCCKMMATD